MEERRFRNKLAQQRFRARQREQEQAFEQAKQAATSQLTHFKALALNLQRQAKDYRGRIDAAEGELICVRTELSKLATVPVPSKQPRTSPRSASIEATYTKVHGTDGAPAFYEDLQQQHRPFPHFAELPPAPVPRWIQQEERPRTFKHHVNISWRDIDAKGPMMTSLAVHRASKARELGCEVEDICWMFHCDRHPLMTVDGAVSSHMGTPECWAKLCSLWHKTITELSALLAIVKRLESAREQLSRRGSFFEHTARSAFDNSGTLVNLSDPTPAAPTHASPPTHPHTAPPASTSDTLASGSQTASNAATLPPPSQHAATPFAAAARQASGSVQSSSQTHTAQQAPRAPVGAVSQAPAPHTERRTSVSSHNGPKPKPAASDLISDDSDASASEWVSHFYDADADACAERMRSRLLVSPQSSIVPELFVPHPSGNAASRLASVLHRVLGDVLQEYVPRMHPADAVLMMRRLKAAFGLQQLPDTLYAEGELTPATAMVLSMASFTRALNTGMQDVRMHSHGPTLPSTLEEIDRALAHAHESMEAVSSEWSFLHYLVQLDQPRFLLGMTQNLNAATVGYGKYEELNLTIYKLLDLSFDQRCMLSSLLSAYRKQSKDLDATRAAAMQVLTEQCSASSQALNAVLTQLRFPHHPPPPQVTSHLSLHARPPQPGRAERPGARLPAQGWGAARHADILGGPRDAAPPPAASLIALEEVGETVLQLRRVQVRKNELLLQFDCLLQTFVLSAKQWAVRITGTLPFLADLHRLAGMAQTDVCCARTFGRAAICAT